MKEKCAIVSCKGLGDGLLIMILSNNLFLNGYETTTFHNGDFYQLQNWFPHLPIEKFPNRDVTSFLKRFDKIFVAHDSADPFIQSVIKEGKEKCPNKIKVLNPSISRNVGAQPFFEDANFKRDISMVDNMENFCKKLNLEHIVRENGITCPYVIQRNSKQIIIHPTSAKNGKMWPKKKYVKLAKKLKEKGFECIFVLTKKEALLWEDVLDKIVLRSFDNLDELAKCVSVSAFMIGNDSGIGHLASCLKVPTLSIFRSKRSSLLWKPSWTKGKSLYPSELIPNISGLRIRDKFWKHFISTRKVLKNFLELAKES